MTFEGVGEAAGGKVCTGMHRVPEARSAQVKGATEAKSGSEHRHLGRRNLVVIAGEGVVESNHPVQKSVPGETGGSGPTKISGPTEISGAKQDAKNLPRNRFQKGSRAKS